MYTQIPKHNTQKQPLLTFYGVLCNNSIFLGMTNSE